MSVEDLEPGTAYAALVVDGAKDTPWVVGTLRSEPNTGLILEIPFLDRSASIGERERAQFEQVERWYDANGSAVPKNLLLHLQDGPVTLFGCTMHGVTKNLFRGTAFGRISAEHAVLAERGGAHADDLRVTRLRSRVDGLKGWSQLAALKETVHADETTRLTERVELVVESEDEISWRQGDVTVSVKSHWEVTGPDDDRRIRDDVVLLTEFDEPHAVEDHLAAQRRVLTLIAVLHGTPIRFREHDVSDDRFATRAGDRVHTPYRRLITRSTLHDRESPVFVKQRARDVLATAPALGHAGIERWNENWDRCQRVIQPVAGRLRRANDMIEDVVVSGSMALEAAAQLLAPAPDEAETYGRGRPTAATFALRSLHAIDAKLPQASASRIGAARAMADIYNTIKHYDRGELPDPLHSYLVAGLTMQTARAVLLLLTVRTNANEEEVGTWGTVKRMFEAVDERFVSNGVFIDAQGKMSTPRQQICGDLSTATLTGSAPKGPRSSSLHR